MISSQASNLLAFPRVQSKKHSFSAHEALEQIRPSHAEVSQQLRNQLQTSLDINELLQMFFAISQRLINFSGLSFQHPPQHLNICHGQDNSDFRMDYRLELEGEYLGTLSLHCKDYLDDQQLASLESLTPALIFPLRNALKYHAVLHASMHDPLTGLRNRTGLSELLERDLQTARRNGSPLSVLMIDIDHFKSINDNFGHAGGDAALVAVAQQLKENLRTVDATFRFGGEEFMAILPNTNAPYVLHVAERLRQALEKTVIIHNGQRIKLSASFGVAIALENENQEDLIQRADGALYMAKSAGRNRVCLAD